MAESEWNKISDLEKATKLAERAVAKPDMDPSYIFAPGYRQHALLGSQFLAAVARAEKAERQLAEVDAALTNAGQLKLRGNDTSLAGRVEWLYNDYRRVHKDKCDNWTKLFEATSERDTALARVAELEGEVAKLRAPRGEPRGMAGWSGI
jgi:hypothetical protein